LTRVAGAAAAVPEEACHEIASMRINASVSQRFWSARGLVMPLGGGGRDLQASALDVFVQSQIRSSSASVVECGVLEVRGQLHRRRRRCSRSFSSAGQNKRVQRFLLFTVKTN
jgi:hypothetical protein